MMLPPISTFLAIIDKEQEKSELRGSRGEKTDGNVGHLGGDQGTAVGDQYPLWSVPLLRNANVPEVRPESRLALK